ncbi:MAG TPA: formate dehydrogenase accessory protein FdhE, partial [Candidatus Limnocylindria bacterium]|nr:formate dehydrogenase accessory protein FdhE [Candidatus Limnocylindria bacterium]
EPAYVRAQADPPPAHALAAYIVRVGLPAVMEATMSAGTELLREAVLLRFHEGDLEGIVRAYLTGETLAETDAFLARAATSPILEALPDVAATLRGDLADERRCPACGGLPQLAVFGDTGEALLTAQRKLVCSRCAATWGYPRMTCVSCRETEGGKMPVFADESRLPHLRIDACDTCRAYLVTVDVRREPGAVPLIDEIVALPLDLAAAERGYTKISRNVMGF